MEGAVLLPISKSSTELGKEPTGSYIGLETQEQVMRYCNERNKWIIRLLTLRIIREIFCIASFLQVKLWL